MGTNLANQIMMSYSRREFSSVRGKMMKEDSGVSNAQAWGCPHATKDIFKKTQASKLGDAPVHPLLHQQLSVRLSFHYIFITSCVMCYAWSVLLFISFLVFFSFACCSQQVRTHLSLCGRETRSTFKI